MKRPLIGLVPQIDTPSDKLVNQTVYFDALRGAGSLPVSMPLTSDPEVLKALVERLDGFLFTGGVDVDPKRFGEAPHPALTELHPKRDEMESLLLPLIMESGKSVFAICRGLQTVNVILGGTLYQDLDTQHPSEIHHRQSPPFDRFCHSVAVLPDTPLHDKLRVDELSVNSIHHQAIKALAPALKPMALSPDGLIEAVYAPDYPYLRAVQWHPERLYATDEFSRILLNDFVNSII